MKPVISIIIPVYNAEKTICRCVESLLMGQERNLQVILADDCSTDHSWDICRELSEKNPQVHCIQNDANRGVSYTRNQALMAVQGDYLLFVDSDDWVSQHYASHLLAAAQQADSNSLVLCGYHYINQVNHTRGQINWASQEQRISEIEMADAFSVMEKTLLQQLWNKIFRRDIIEQFHIRFDENQSMGEDFQFVLDYMEAMQCKKCVVLNEPLYYYIRWNNSSLMSKFGFIQNQLEFARIDQLHRLSGVPSTERRDAMIAQSKRNYIYHIVRSPNHRKQEKLEAIERIMGDGKSRQHYRHQIMQYRKENALLLLKKMKALPARLEGRRMRKQRDALAAQMKTQLSEQDFSIISQNCIGGVLYHDMGLQFLSPTINTFIPEPGFVQMVLNLRHYMEQELVMRWGEEYPIGKLDDVEIHFMHYETCQEAKEAWDRRKQRINWDKIFVIGTDRDGFDEAVYEQWKQLPYPKILFTAHPEFTEDAVYYPEYAADGMIGDLISERRFYADCQIVTMLNSLKK